MILVYRLPTAVVGANLAQRRRDDYAKPVVLRKLCNLQLL